MNEIKMKDMLTLPVKRVPGGIMPFLKDGSDEVLFVGDGYHVDACVLAINAYDADQELIERYRKLVCQTCDGHGAVGNILDSMDCPDCTLYVGPSEEIASLKAELEQHDDQITNIEIVNQELMVSVKQQAIRDAIFNSEHLEIDGHKYVCLEDLEVNINQLRTS